MGGALRASAIIASILLYSTIVIGGFVKALDAGLACGTDWPTCNGYVIPPGLFSDRSVLLEYMHRLVGGLASIFIVIAFIYSMLYGRRQDKLLASATVLLIVVQVLLGMAVIKSYLDELIVALHLSFATASLVTASILAYSLATCKNS
ncbi:MAG: COX15/CtaA family protein [Desulfurococcales archaeon]|nr:COX15/CtaA family protein [Desulfurococcales archaeon]